jgi:hypothetical protein
MAPGAARTPTSYWSLAKVMRVVDGTQVHLRTGEVRIRAETTLCAGEGPSIRSRGIRRWHWFACTFTTFTPRGLDRDLDFRIRVLGLRRLAIVDPRWVGAAR